MPIGEAVRALTDGRGTDSVIGAVRMESHGSLNHGMRVVYLVTAACTSLPRCCWLLESACTACCFATTGCPYWYRRRIVASTPDRCCWDLPWLA